MRVRTLDYDRHHLEPASLPAYSRWLTVAGCCLLLAQLRCGGPQARREPVEVVPAGSAFVLVSDWPATRGDVCLRKMASADEVERQLAGIGLAGNDVAEVAVCALASDPANTETFVVSGSFRPRAVLQSLRGQGWTPETYHRYRVARSPSGNVCAAAVGSNVVAFGRPAGVLAVLDVARGKAEPFCEQTPYCRMVQRYRQQQQPVYAVVVVPQEVQDAGQAALGLSTFACGLLGLDAVGSVLSGIPSTRALGVTMTPAGGDYRSELGAVLSDEKAASMITGGFGLLKGLATVLAQTPSSGREGQEALAQANKMAFTRDGEIVYIAMTMTAEEVLR